MSPKNDEFPIVVITKEELTQITKLHPNEVFPVLRNISKQRGLIYENRVKKRSNREGATTYLGFTTSFDTEGNFLQRNTWIERERVDG